jgi:hypothetical protein
MIKKECKGQIGLTPGSNLYNYFNERNWIIPLTKEGTPDVYFHKSTDVAFSSSWIKEITPKEYPEYFI